jgi:DNA repair exonuclease SbcCD ATPase subunit
MKTDLYNKIYKLCKTTNKVLKYKHHYIGLESVDVIPESSQENDVGFIASEDLSDKTQQRINKLTWERHEAERKAAAQASELSTRIAELEQKLSSSSNSSQPLTLEQFDYDQDKFNQALIDQRVNQGIEQAMSRLNETQTVAQQQQELAQKQQSYNASSQEYAASNPEFIELVGTMGNAVTSEAVAGFLMDSAIGPKMQHNLLKNYSELQRIQSLPPLAQAAELGRLEAKLSMPQVKNVSNAPDPVDPLTGGADLNNEKGVSTPKLPM